MNVSIGGMHGWRTNLSVHSAFRDEREAWLSDLAVLADLRSKDRSAAVYILSTASDQDAAVSPQRCRVRIARRDHAAGGGERAGGRVVELGAGKGLETVAFSPGDQDLAVTKQCCCVVGSRRGHVANGREVASGRGSRKLYRDDCGCARCRVGDACGDHVVSSRRVRGGVYP